MIQGKVANKAVVTSRARVLSEQRRGEPKNSGKLYCKICHGNRFGVLGQLLEVGYFLLVIMFVFMVAAHLNLLRAASPLTQFLA